jgi:hypothetical protein
MGEDKYRLTIPMSHPLKLKLFVLAFNVIDV